MANSLPATSTTLQEFRNLSYHIGVYGGAPGEAELDRKLLKECWRVTSDGPRDPAAWSNLAGGEFEAASPMW
jgi:hypothetical protein